MKVERNCTIYAKFTQTSQQTKCEAVSTVPVLLMNFNKKIKSIQKRI